MRLEGVEGMGALLAGTILEVEVLAFDVLHSVLKKAHSSIVGREPACRDHRQRSAERKSEVED